MFCDVGSVNWPFIKEVLGRDSQAGTIYDRKERSKATRELTPDLVQDIYEMLETRPLLRTPDVQMPRTLIRTFSECDGPEAEEH
jgi:hypothetical protein